MKRKQRNQFMEFLEQDMNNGRIFYKSSIELCYRFGFRPDIAEDIIQEVIEHTARTDPKYKPKEGTQEAFLYECIKNKCMDYLRRRRQPNFTSLNFPEGTTLTDIISDDQPTPLETLEEEEKIQKLRGAIAGLSPTTRKTAELRASGFSYQQIADTLNVPEGTVKSTLYRAKKHLAKLLRD